MSQPPTGPDGNPPPTLAGPPVPAQQPYGAPPVSGGPSGQPMSAPPMSGGPWGQPMSAPPGPVGAPASGLPYGVPPVSVRPEGRRVLLLAIAAGVLFVVGAMMTGLFVAKSSQADRTERQLTAKVADRDATIAANGGEIERLKRDLEAANDKLGTVEQDLSGTKNDRDEQQRQKQVIGRCLDQLNTALGAAAAHNRAAYDKAAKGLDQVCNEAQRYL
jgi:hypothetical protein